MGIQLVIKRSVFYCVHIFCFVIVVLCLCIVARADDMPVALPESAMLIESSVAASHASHQPIIPFVETDEHTSSAHEIIVKFKEEAAPYSKDVIADILKSSQFESRRICPIDPALKRHKAKIDSKSNRRILHAQAPRTDEELFREAYSSMSPKEKALYNIVKVSLPEKMKLADALNSFNKDPNVEYAESNYIYHIAQPADIQSSDDSSYALPIPEETLPKKGLPVIHNLPTAPNDYLFAHQWPLNNIGQGYYAVRDGDLTLVEGTSDADIDWLEQNGQMPTEKVIVAVVDTGVDYTHPDLAGQLWTNEGEIPDNGIDDDLNGFIDDVYGYDTYNEDGDPMDDHGHGTHCSGTIAARTNNAEGISGVYPVARIMPVKCFSYLGSATTEVIIPAIQYAVENGAQVLSNSWGGGGYSQALVDIIAYAREKGCVFVAAAGNSNTSVEMYPAAYEGVVAVAATDGDDHKAWFSNYGSWVDIAAPGVDILSLRAAGTDMYRDGGTHIIDENYYLANGTSMAAPHAAGVVAAIVGKWPGQSPDFYEDMLLATSDSIDDINPNYIKALGAGRINIARAVMGDEVVARVSTHIVSDGDVVRPGENAQLHVMVSTLLQPVSEAVVHVVNNSDFLTFNRTSYSLVDLPSMSRITLPEDTFIFSVSEDAELGAAIPVHIELHVDNQIASTEALKLVPHNYRILASGQSLSLTYFSSKALTATPDGSVHVVYKDYVFDSGSYIKHVWRDPEMKLWQEPIVVTHGSVNNPIITSDASGNLYVLYYAVSANNERDIYCRRKLSSDTVWSEPMHIYSLPPSNGYTIYYAMETDDDAIHAVINIPGSSESIAVYLKYRDGQWSEPEEVVLPNSGPAWPVVALSPQGTLFIAGVLHDEGDIAYLFRYPDGTWSSITRAGFTDCSQFDAVYDTNGTLHLAVVDKEMFLNYVRYHPEEEEWLLIDRRTDLYYSAPSIQIGRNGKAHIVASAYDIDSVFDDNFASRLLHLQYDVYKDALDDADIIEVGLPGSVHMHIDEENRMHTIFIYYGENLSRFGQVVLAYVEKELPPPVNQAPVLEPIGDKMVSVGEKLYFEITASDENNDILMYAIENLPDGAVIIQYNKTDINGDGYVDEDDFSIFKQHYNSAAGDDNYNIDCDFIEDGKINLSDFALFGSMYGKALREENDRFNKAAFIWKPHSDDIGQYEVTIAVSDQHTSDDETVRIDVCEDGASCNYDNTYSEGTGNKEPDIIIVDGESEDTLLGSGVAAFDIQQPLRINKINLGLFDNNPFKDLEFYELSEQWSRRYKAYNKRGSQKDNK